MPRRRPRPPPPPIEDRDLAADVLYLHSLWHRGPPAPAPASVPVPDLSPAPTAKPSRSARHNANRRKRRRLERAAAAETEDAESDRPLEPSPPASPSPAEPTPPSPGSPAVECVIYNGDHIRAANYRRQANRRKRRWLERHAADAQGAGEPLPRTPSPSASSEARPSASPRAWPDAAPVPAKPPPPPLSPGSLAQQEAIRAAEEFFSKDGSENKGPESEGDEEAAAAAFFTGMFEWDAALRGHYERRWEEPERRFPCLACAGRKMRRGKRPYLGCVGLVQHARDYSVVSATSMRPGAHRALVAVVCRVLGWDIESLPSILSSLLAPVLAAKAQSDAHEAKEDVEEEMKDSNTGGDGAANELVPKESAQMERVAETGPLNCRDSTKNNVVGNETIQQEDAVKNLEEPASIDGVKEITELGGGKESSEKDNANKDDSLSQDDNGVVHGQEIARETTEKENIKDTCSKDTRDNEKHCIKASVQEEVNATEENVDENKEHANSIS